MHRCILYASEAYRSPEVKSFVRNRTKFNEECFGSWNMKTNVSDTHLCSCVTFLQMFNEIGEVVMRLRYDIEGHKRMNTWHPVGSNYIVRIPHISRMWDAIILGVIPRHQSRSGHSPCVYIVRWWSGVVSMHRRRCTPWSRRGTHGVSCSLWWCTH